MTTVAVVAALLLVAGVLGGAPGLVLLGLLSLATTGLSGLWSRRGLDRLRYERHLGADRMVVGDQLELDLMVENAKLLPLAWLATDDYATDGLVVLEHPLVPSDRPGLGVLRNVWTLGPFERVVRHFRLVAARRGRYRFEMVRLTVADLFGRGVASVEQARPSTLIVRPRSVPVQGTGGQFVPLGSRRARQGLLEDPVLFAGVRPFQPGDPRRRIHQRASARLGRPVSRRYEPSTARHVLVALDVQTHPGPHWLLAYDDELVESLVVTAASLARDDGARRKVEVHPLVLIAERAYKDPRRPGRAAAKCSFSTTATRPAAARTGARAASARRCSSARPPACRPSSCAPRTSWTASRKWRGSGTSTCPSSPLSQKLTG